MKNVSVFELAFELFRSGVKPEDIARKIGVSRVTIYRWLKGIKYRGWGKYKRKDKEALQSLINQYLVHTIQKDPTWV